MPCYCDATSGDRSQCLPVIGFSHYNRLRCFLSRHSSRPPIESPAMHESLSYSVIRHIAQSTLLRSPIRTTQVLLATGLLIAVMQRPDVALNLPAYLADLFAGPPAAATLGLVWLSTATASLTLFAGIGGAAFLIGFACLENVVLVGSELSFIPWLTSILPAIGISGDHSRVAIHVGNLVIAILTLALSSTFANKRCSNGVG